MAAEGRAQVEVFVLVDASGDYATGRSHENVIEDYEACIQPLADSEGYRVVKIMVDVPLPSVIEAEVEVKDDGTAVVSMG